MAGRTENLIVVLDASTFISAALKADSIPEDDVPGVRGQRVEAGADAGLTSGAAGDGGQVGEAIQRFGDRGGVADRLDQGGMGGEGLGGVSDDPAPGEGGELLRGVGAEPAAGPGGGENGGDGHGYASQ